MMNQFYISGGPLPKLSSDMNFADFILKKFSDYKDNVAIIDAVTGARISYGDIVKMTKKLAASFTSIGVRKGHRIAICADKRPDTIPTILATLYVGAVHTFIHPEGPVTISQRMTSIQPDVIICPPEVYQNHKTLLEQPCVKTFIVYGDEKLEASYTFNELLKGEGTVEPAKINGLVDFATIAFTSGTTAPSKSIPWTHLQWIATTTNVIDQGYYKNKKVLVTHFVALWLPFLNAGVTTVFVNGETGKDIIKPAEKYKVDAMLQMPTTMTAVVRSPLLAAADLSSVQRVLCFGSPLSQRLIEEIRDKIPSVTAVCQIYGTTETAGLTSDERQGPRPNSIGTALPGIVIKIVDLKTGELLGPNERGEICAKGVAPIPAYLGMSSTDHTDSEGFYKTGDLGYYDEDHYFYIVDRIKDIIKCNGFAVAPQDLENIITSHEEVVEAAVVGAPHEIFYEVPVAFVVPRAGSQITTDDVTKFVNDKIPSWMHLAGVSGGTIFLKELPRGTRGKIDRKALRKLVLAMYS